MKTIEEVLDFSKKFTFYNHYNFENVVELNLVRDCINIISSKLDHTDENL